MPDWFGILLTILSVFIGGFALGVKFGEWDKEQDERNNS